MNKKWQAMAEALLALYAAPMNLALRSAPMSKRMGLTCALFKHLYAAEEYCQISAFPKKVAGLPVKGTNRDFSDVAIVLQGPVTTKDDFTLNTIRMYKQYYDGIKIIVSTWIDTDEKTISALRAEEVDIQLCEYPSSNPPGSGNLNYQLSNSLLGVQKAKELGVRYAAKTRTDQRYYNPCALPMLLGAHEQGKLILLGGVLNSFYARPFYISDFFAFGEVDELESYYQCEFDSDEPVEKRVKAKKTESFKNYLEWVNKADLDCGVTVPQEFDDAVVRFACAETRIAYSYYLRKTAGREYDNTKEAYDCFLRDYVILIDADSLGFYWLKHNYQVLNPSYFQRPGKLDAAKWFELKRQWECEGRA